MKISFRKKLDYTSEEWWVSSVGVERKNRNELRDKIKLHFPNAIISEDKPEDGNFGSALHNNFNFVWFKFSDVADEAEFIMKMYQ